jgi:hypothetical protein
MGKVFGVPPNTARETRALPKGYPGFNAQAMRNSMFLQSKMISHF